MTTVTTSAVLRAEALGWSVDEKTILSGVSVDVRPQMMTMIIGLNGSGKTTLLHLLAGLRKQAWDECGWASVTSPGSAPRSAPG
ncbi:hypothetical protein HMPREF9603_01665 [Cutibacterium acnes HL001PA1]|nr:hypothetical protein HMPREF9603_01665 [Cutibacterium acnes HL001PA1]